MNNFTHENTDVIKKYNPVILYKLSCLEEVNEARTSFIKRKISNFW